MGAGPVGPLVTVVFHASAAASCLAAFRLRAAQLHDRQGDCLHRVAVHRGDHGVKVWQKWTHEYPCGHPVS